jgi:hypothetical protein
MLFLPITGIIPEPDGPWMKQVARNLTDGIDGFLSGCRYLIHDRASVFSAMPLIGFDPPLLR